MKRFVAYVIDYIIMSVFLMVLSWGVLIKWTDNINLLMLSSLFIIFLYFGISDFAFYGSSIGKRVMGLTVILKQQSLLKFSIHHALLKTAYTCISVISFGIYIFCGYKMPYDKLFYERIG